MSTGPFVVLDGYVLPKEGEGLTIITLGGDQVTVPAESLEMSVPIEARTENKAVRLFLKRGAVVSIQVAAEAFRGIGGGTIAKFLDDGGTVRKSLDDTQLANGL